jgi:hypothetical protein
LEFAAEHFQPADMIAMFVREEHTVELRGRNAAKCEPVHDLARAQAAIDEEPAMFGSDERAISRTAAAEHGESEHCRLIADSLQHSKKNQTDEPDLPADLHHAIG